LQRRDVSEWHHADRLTRAEINWVKQ
jgi:hypothetical protein